MSGRGGEWSGGGEEDMKKKKSNLKNKMIYGDEFARIQGIERGKSQKISYMWGPYELCVCHLNRTSWEPIILFVNVAKKKKISF